MHEEGYAAATVRRIASRAGLKHQAIFYYFGTQDDLLVALLRRRSEAHRERLNAALKSPQPFQALWDIIRDPNAIRFTLEFMALANHSEGIRKEIARNAEALRALEANAIAEHLSQRGSQSRLSPQLVSILINAVARLLVQEAALGIRAGHDDLEALVERSLRNFAATGHAGTQVETVVNADTLGSRAGRKENSDLPIRSA